MRFTLTQVMFGPPTHNMAKAITESDILNSPNILTKKIEAVLQKVTYPVTYTYKGKEVTINRVWSEGMTVWLDISVKGMVLGDRNPFGFTNPPTKIGTGVYDDFTDKDGFHHKERMTYNPLEAMKEALNQALEVTK